MREAAEKEQEGAVGIVGRLRAHGRKQVMTTQAFVVRWGGGQHGQVFQLFKRTWESNFYVKSHSC